MRSWTTAAVIVAVWAVPIHAQSLNDLLDRMGAYLNTYEGELSQIIADERYDQREYGRDPLARLRTVREKRLDSEVAFLRLPGNGYWYGFRSVRMVDKKLLKPPAPKLADFLSTATDLDTQHALMMAASSAHNLGMQRTLNMPTVPLAVVQASNRELIAFRDGGTESVGRVKTRRISFDEIGESTLIRHMNRFSVKTRGQVWVEPDTGRVWRVEIDCRDPGDQHGGDLAGNFTVRVEFVMHKALEMLVPSEMIETFPATVARGEGRATYRNFRRFQTSARIITPPPR